MLFQKFAQSLALWRYRSRTADPGSTLSISHSLKQVRKVLVCVPEAAEELVPIIPALGSIRAAFPQARVSILASETMALPNSICSGMKLINWKMEDRNRWGGPTAACKRRIFQDTFDIVIDLNHRLQFFSLAVVMASGAPLRVGYAEPTREELYTLLFRPQTLDPDRALEGLLVYISQPTG